MNLFSKFKIILNKKLKKNEFFLKGYRIGGRPFLDTFFSYGFNITSSIILRKKLWEITAHPTLFSKHLFKKYKKVLPNDFSIDLFLYYLAKKNQYLIKKIHFPYKDRKHGVSKWNKNFLSKINLMIKYILKIFKLMYLDMFKIIKWKNFKPKIIIDIDGVMTSGHMIYTSKGKVGKFFGPDDHDALKLLENIVQLNLFRPTKLVFNSKKKIDSMNFKISHVPTHRKIGLRK